MSRRPLRPLLLAQNLCGLDALAAHFSSSPLEEAAPLTTGLRTLLRAYAKAAPAATVKPSHLHGAVVKRAPRFKARARAAQRSAAVAVCRDPSLLP